jgi:hypothetical protein
VTTPPLTCPVVSCQADTHALTEHLYDHSAGVLAHTLAGAAAEFARLEEVIAKRDTALAQARAERDRAERRQQPAEAENTPLTLVPLRDAVCAAILAETDKPRADRLGLVDAMLAVVWPQLDAARRSAQAAQDTAHVDAERLRGDLAIARAQARDARNIALTEGARLIETHARTTGLLDLLGAVDLLLAARTQPAT